MTGLGLDSSRNTSLGFATRTRKNLEFLRHAADAGADVHVVTQLVNSLLGLVVFPWEVQFDERYRIHKLSDLASAGWPNWDVRVGRPETLGQLAKHLRDGTAHRRIMFSSESRRLDEVEIEFSNYPRKGEAVPNFVASIRADGLLDFCLRFTDLVHEEIG